MKRIIIALLCALPLACAVPVPPTGGPPDKEPPILVQTSPENGTIGFSGRDLQFVFNEAVDIRSFTKAFSISPDLAGVPEISGSSKRIRVRLPQDPRPETTYIVSLETSLRDVHSISLDKPISIAFSTGQIIDAARMQGRVVGSLDGAPVAGADIYAYADNDSVSLAGPPLYRTQSAASGDFLFEHVAERDYFVVALRDGNRNRMLDGGEVYGVPPVARMKADSLGTPPEFPWILAERDTTPPSLERIRVVSPRDLELRFSELLDLDMNRANVFTRPDPSDVMVYDSLEHPISDVHFYLSEGRSRTLFARVDSLSPGRYTLKGQTALRDSSQQIASGISAAFTISEGLPSVERPAFLTWTPDSSVVTSETPRTIWPFETFGFRTTRPADGAFSVSMSDTLNPVFSGIIRDTTGMSYSARFSQVEPAFFVLQKSGAFPFNAPFHLDINQRDFGGPDSVVTGFFRFAERRNMGSIAVAFQDSDRAVAHSVRLEAFDRSQSPLPYLTSFQTAPSDGNILLDNLPGGKKIQLRMALVRNRGTWQPGTLRPWSPPEPIAWVEFDEPVRARWETVLPDTIDFRNWPFQPVGVDSSRTP
jgi:hypothetical protein